MDTNNLNVALIALNELKWKNKNDPELLRAVCTVYKERASDLEFEGDNKHQIWWSKHVWNALSTSSRYLMIKSNTTKIMRILSDANLTRVTTAALDAHLRDLESNAQSQQDYLDIVARYNDLKVIQRNEGPFTRNLTEKERLFILKFESRENESRGQIQNLPNQNAVTYVFLLAKMMKIMNIGINLPIKQMIKIITDILLFVETQGDKTVKTFQSVINKYNTIVGSSNVDVKPMFERLMASPEWQTADEASSSNKYLSNNKLTLKRLYRMTHVFKVSSTPWGLLSKTKDKDFAQNLTALYDAELAVNSPDMKSLAIIWYLVIGRQHMSCVMVDHHEESGKYALQTLINQNPTDALLQTPDHVFNFEHPFTENMTFD